MTAHLARLVVLLALAVIAAHIAAGDPGMRQNTKGT